MADLLIVADEWDQMKPLQAFLEAAGHAVATAEDKDVEADLSSYYAVFMYLHKVVEQNAIDAMIAYANGGGRLVILHHGMASAKLKNPDWLAFAGIHIEPKDAETNPWTLMVEVTHELVRLDPRHYISTNGVDYPTTTEYTSSDGPSKTMTFPSITFTDTEFFKNQHIADGREKTVLFGTKCTTKDGEVVMQDRGGWLKPSGDGWIFYFQPGHLPKDFEEKAYQQIILNCLTWDLES